MRIHHLNCATMCPYGGRLIHGQGGWFSRARIVCHCLLIETGDGLVLVDTGLGTKDVADPKRLGRPFVSLARPRLDPEETAVQQVVRLGFKKEDVRHIVLTHLDVDHAGGIADFPQAEVHVHARECEEAFHPRTFIERRRYIQAQWAGDPKWARHSPAGETWLGFERVQALTSGLTEVLLIPLHGHTHGHCGVAINLPNGWLLHCGDAYFHRGEMESEHPHCPLALNLFQRLLEMDRHARLHNQQRLRQLLHDRGEEVTIFCAHDPAELSYCQQAAE